MSESGTLMLHCGADEVPWADVELCPTPESTKSHVPIPHAELIRGVLDRVTSGGLEIVQQRHSLTKGGLKYFGLVEVRPPGENPDDYGLVLGLRNAHDKTASAGIAVGAGVFVCDNLSFSGEAVLSRAHTKNIRRDLPRVIATAVGRIGELRGIQDKRFDAYRNYPLCDVEAHDLMIQALDVKALGSTSIPPLVNEWRKPSYDYGDEKTIWRFFNGCTEVMKRIKVDARPARTIALHGLLDSYCGLRLTA